MGKSETKAKNKYNKKMYERINLTLKKGEKQKIVEISKNKGESVNSFIRKSILNEIKDEFVPESYNFSVYYKNELCSDVRTEGNTVHIRRYTKHPAKQLFASDEIPRYKLGEILSLRCWDENRADLDAYLKKIGLDSFNPYEICRKTHGIMFQDSIWFRFEGEMFDGMAVIEKIRKC